MQKTKSVSLYLGHKSWTTTIESCHTFHSALQTYVSTTQSQKHGHFECKGLDTPNQRQMYQLQQRPTAVSLENFKILDCGYTNYCDDEAEFAYHFTLLSV